MIKEFSKEEYVLYAREPLLRLFNNEAPDPFSNPFSPEVDGKIVITGGAPKDELLDVIKLVAREYGDEGFYLHSPENKGKRLYKLNWYVPFDDLRIFKSKTFADYVEVYVYYSPQGLWGLVTSDIHSVLGGSNDFLRRIQQSIPDINDDVLHFIHYWLKTKEGYPELNIDIRWLLPMIVGIYGADQAKELMSKADELDY